MQAVVQYALKARGVELRQVAAPAAPADDEVLLQTSAVGICGSEIHQYHNTHSWPVNVPVVLGHEGDPVVSETAARICGHCAYCRAGDYNLCPERQGFGYNLDGGMAEFVAVPARCLHHLPDSIPLEKAALAEPCSVAFNAMCVKTHIRAGASVLVLGPGPIGLLCLALARLSGVGWLGIFGLEQDARRLAIARSMGADRAINAGNEDVLEVVRSVGDGLGVDVVHRTRWSLYVRDPEGNRIGLSHFPHEG